METIKLNEIISLERQSGSQWTATVWMDHPSGDLADIAYEKGDLSEKDWEEGNYPDDLLKAGDQMIIEWINEEVAEALGKEVRVISKEPKSFSDGYTVDLVIHQ